MLFLDIIAGWPGSVHDSRVLRNSGLYQTAAIKFPGDTHLLGDGGYPLLRSVKIVQCNCNLVLGTSSEASDSVRVAQQMKSGCYRFCD